MASLVTSHLSTLISTTEGPGAAHCSQYVIAEVNYRQDGSNAEKLFDVYVNEL